MKSLYRDLPVVRIGGFTLAGRLVFGLLVLAAAVIGALSGMLIVYSTDLPQIDELARYRPSAITELYDDHGRIIGSFALQRRINVNYSDLPQVLVDAVTSIEDKDFETHWGIDLRRILGAAVRDMRSGSRSQGASTLTMQLARNLFLSPERSFRRKIQEIILSIQIERRFTKEQIFTMYANQIYLGHGVYGFEAGSEFYFGKPARQLTIEEAATLASLPKSPVLYSPILNPRNAMRRRTLVIDAMLEDGKITAAQAAAAREKPLGLNLQPATNSVAPYFTEEIRRYLENKYGSDEVHQDGLKVYTTLNLEMQLAANKAALDGLAAYERRHGWKGHLVNIPPDEMAHYHHPDWTQAAQPGDYIHGLVTEVDPSSATIKIGSISAQLSVAQMAWTHAKSAEQILKTGDIVYVRVLPSSSKEGSKDGPIESAKEELSVALEQDSGAQVSLMAVDNTSGDIKAMVGGRDFALSKFNRATQALRQVGSSFKPYVYTAAIDTGAFSPEDYILDAPTTFMTPGGPYTPSNYDGRFWGNIPLRKAIADSRNIPALKIAEKVGIKTVIDYAHRFGVTANIPPYLPIALGAAEITLFEQTAAYSTFPNDGVRLSPRYIKKVVDYDGHVREEDFPEVKDVISVNTSRAMVSLLQEVVKQGTAVAALKMKHPLAGKTGTTNNFTDAWFVGFSPSITCGVWVGFDEKISLGPKETGSEAALPIWMDFMKVALAGRDAETFPPYQGSPQKPHPSRAMAAPPEKSTLAARIY